MTQVKFQSKIKHFSSCKIIPYLALQKNADAPKAKRKF